MRLGAAAAGGDPWAFGMAADGVDFRLEKGEDAVTVAEEAALAAIFACRTALLALAAALSSSRFDWHLHPWWGWRGLPHSEHLPKGASGVDCGSVTPSLRGA